MNKNLVVLCLMLCGNLTAQENSKSKLEPFTTPFAKVFNNFHSGLSENNSFSAFQITKAYLGSYFTLSENFKFKVNFDIGNLSNGSKYERTVYVKNAYLTYHKGKLAINIAKATACHAFSYYFTTNHNIKHGHAVALTL